MHHNIRFLSPTLSSDSTASPTVMSSVAGAAPQPGTSETMAMANSTALESTVANSTMDFADPAISSAVAADATQSSSAATTSVLSDRGPVGDNFGRNMHHNIRFLSPTLSGDSIEPTAANSTMAFADPVMLADSTTAALSSYSPASSSPVGAVFSTEAAPGPTPPPPLAEPLLPGNLMAPNGTQIAPPPPVGLAALSHNSSHMTLNGTSSAPATPMSMVSPASVLPVLPTSAVPAASAALSLAGGLSPLTLIGLSVGVSAFMFGIGALHGRYADDKKEQ